MHVRIAYTTYHMGNKMRFTLSGWGRKYNVYSQVLRYSVTIQNPTPLHNNDFWHIPDENSRTLFLVKYNKAFEDLVLVQHADNFRHLYIHKHGRFLLIISAQCNSEGWAVFVKHSLYYSQTFLCWFGCTLLLYAITLLKVSSSSPSRGKQM